MLDGLFAKLIKPQSCCTIENWECITCAEFLKNVLDLTKIHRCRLLEITVGVVSHLSILLSLSSSFPSSP